jgi:hypothetical protein
MQLSTVDTANSDLRVVDYRIEARGDGFVILIRRQLGVSAVVMSLVFCVFLGVGLWGMWTFARAGWASLRELWATTRPSERKGVPVCCVPFILGFFCLWLRPVLIGIRAHVDRLRGREAWLFTGEGVTPPAGINELEPSAMLAVGEVRAGVCHIREGWALGISNRVRHLTIGPFAEEGEARRLATKVRARRPAWFVEADGTEAVYGLPAAAPATGPGPLEAVVGYGIAPEAGGFRLTLERGKRGVRPGTVFLMVWLAGWAFGEVMVGRELISRLTSGSGGEARQVAPSTRGGGGGGRREKAPPPMIFMGVWLAFWTFGGAMAIWRLAVNFRARETWVFGEEEVRAGSNWQFPTGRRLSARGKVLARMRGDGSGGRVIELIAEGVSVEIGPFAREEVAEGVVRELKALRPWWDWGEGS